MLPKMGCFRGRCQHCDAPQNIFALCSFHHPVWGWGNQLCEKKSEYCQNFIHFLTHKSICLAFIWLLSVQDQMLDISDIAKSGELWNDFNFNVIAPQVRHVNDGNISISIWSWNLNIWPAMAIIGVRPSFTHPSSLQYIFFFFKTFSQEGSKS